MVGALFPWVMIALMFAASVLAFVQVPADARLPMQWGIRGQVIWRAPRAVALFFTPVLAVLIIGLITLIGAPTATGSGRATMAVAVLLLLVHALHVFLVLREVAESRAPGAPRQSGQES
jgi:hypothetical protein